MPIALPLKGFTCAPATSKSETPGGKRWTVWLAATNMNARGAESSSRDPREKRVTKGRIGPVGLFDLSNTCSSHARRNRFNAVDNGTKAASLAYNNR